MVLLLFAPSRKKANVILNQPDMHVIGLTLENVKKKTFVCVDGVVDLFINKSAFFSFGK